MPNGSRAARRGLHRSSTPPRFGLRRLLAVGAVLACLGLIGGGVYAAVRATSGTGGTRRHLAGESPSVAAVTPVTTPPPPSTTTTLPPPPPEPGGGQTLFPSHRLVAFYGVPAVPRLGVLGNAPPDVLWPQLAAAATPYSTAGTVVVPSYELIAFTAQAAPGPQGFYSAEIPSAEIDSYLQTVQAHGGMLILDVQPGRNSLLAEAQALEPWLIQPDVGLALDPEWELQPGELPDRQIGHTTAAEINQVSAWLEQLTVAHRLPQKLLLVHQFRAAMIPDKPAVTAQPDLAVAFNMDGFGGTANKVSVYQILAGDPRWAIGYKLFYTRDVPLQTPAQILALAPTPEIIEYE